MCNGAAGLGGLLGFGLLWFAFGVCACVRAGAQRGQKRTPDAFTSECEPLTVDAGNRTPPLQEQQMLNCWAASRALGCGCCKAKPL